MTADARRAIAVIHACVDEDRYALTVHFSERMEQRGLFWPDVLAAIGNPQDVRSQGLDDFGRPKWLVRGGAAPGDEIEIICAVETDQSETTFITLYWED